MTLLSNLFDFAYIPSWHEQLNELAALALPEPWRFKKPNYQGKNLEHPILERYIQSVFRKQVIDYNCETNPDYKPHYLYITNEYACFHTDSTLSATNRSTAASAAINGRTVC